MKKVISILLLFVVTNVYAINYYFTVTDDIDVENNKKYAFVSKNTELIVNGQDFNTEFNPFDNLPQSPENKIFFYIDFNNERFLFDEEYLDMKNCNLETPKELKNSLWIMNYYYESLRKRDLNIILDHEPYSHLLPQFIDENTDLDGWKNYFIPLNLMFGKYCLIGNQNNFSSALLELLFVPESYDKNIYIVNVLDVTHQNSYESQYQWREMFRNSSDFKLLFKLDGDYLFVYKNEINDTNLLYELAKADDNTIEQIKRFVKTGEYDINSIKFPRHGSNKDTDYNGNILIHRIMTVKENLKLRKGEATTTEIITVMASGTKVKIMQIGKSEKIDDFNTNWVQVEVQSEAKDRNGNDIKAGITGWCYGGYLE